MATEVIMPKVDMVMEAGTFMEWLKHEGDFVRKDEPLFIIMTDKAAIEIGAPASGILAGVKARPEDVIPVSETIAYLLAEGESLPDGASKALEPASPAKANERQPALEAAEARPAPPPIAGNKKVRATPLARRMAAQLGLDLKQIDGRGPKGRIHKADVLSAAGTARQPALEAAEARPAPPLNAGNKKMRATPLARRMAAQLGLDLRQIDGRGPKGRIHKADILSAAGTARQPEPAAPQPRREFALPEVQVPLPEARVRATVPLAGPRKIIAQRMAYSAATAPHIHLSLSVDMSEAGRLRSQVAGSIEKKTGKRVSYTAILARAVAAILPSHPFLNASLAGEEIVLWEDVHLGIATSIDDYLIVPVIRQAQDKSLPEIVASLADLVERAHSKRLAPQEMSGSTFTISNLGMFGIETFTSIINPPESAILSIGKIVERPVREEAGSGFRPMAQLTINVDHRIVDGVAAARFLAALKETIENPYLLL